MYYAMSTKQKSKNHRRTEVVYFTLFLGLDLL